MSQSPLVKNRRVCAIVVTFNRKELLEHCLRAVEPQLKANDCMLIVDNASSDGTPEFVKSCFPQATYLRLDKNIGGAGGFAEGMKWAFDNCYRWMWLMDDDGVPEIDCLDKLVASGSDFTVATPIQRDVDGRTYGISTWKGRNVDITNQILQGMAPSSGPYLFTFVGPLIPRRVVEQIGFPNPDFFIWFDDHEFSLRLAKEKGFQVMAVTDAIFCHDMGLKSRTVTFLGRTSVRSDVAPWKIYYGIRNPLYTLLYKRKKAGELFLFIVIHARLLAMDLFYGPNRGERIAMRLLGARDGLLGRLGQRARKVEPQS